MALVPCMAFRMFHDKLERKEKGFFFLLKGWKKEATGQTNHPLDLIIGTPTHGETPEGDLNP